MADATRVGGHSSGSFSTSRTDAWWLQPLLVVVGLGIFGLYYTWAAWQASFFHVGPYGSPAYAPLVFGVPDPGHTLMTGGVEASLLGLAWPSWWPKFIPASPAFMIALFPTVFRGTCYYYRKAYYRSFFGMPPACAVGPSVPHNYRGETFFLVLQNIHRYAMYIALLLVPLLLIDGVKAFGVGWGGGPGIGIGSIIILGTGFWLGCYTVGCHAFRHLVGGFLNKFSGGGARGVGHTLWKGVTWLNKRHATFAWISLYWFLFSDVYVRLLAMGYIPDLNTWGGLMWAEDFIKLGHVAGL